MTLEDIALQMTPGIGIKGAIHLLETFGSAEAVFSASDEELRLDARLRDDLIRQIRNRKGFAPAEKEIRHCQRHNIKAIASTDEDYPRLLREIPDYPHVIYVQGNVDALHRRTLSMVGTREASPYGQIMCNRIVEQLSERMSDLCIVSGLAFGIDIASHRAALAAGVSTVAVLPCPLPDILPAQHSAVARDILESGGALLTEIHSQSRLNGTAYTARNRIIAALSAGCLVVESGASGGSLITANFANDYFRTVMALPGRATDKNSAGTNHLIRNNKATLVTSADEIMEELGWYCNTEMSRPERHKVEESLTTEERKILSLFHGSDPLSVENLLAESGCDAGELATLLLGMELSGAVKQLPGNRYIKTL